MATDGVKIIDGDLAFDTYWGIMDLYDSNIDIASIKKELPFIREEYGREEDFYHEIFVTSYALAFWEIGELSDDVFQEVKLVIDKGAGVIAWTEEAGAKEGKARQKELDKLWKKISQPNTKIRSRKKYRKITNLHFIENDLLTFKLFDNSYRALLCTEVQQYRGECVYWLTPTDYISNIKPTENSIFAWSIFGRTIVCTHSREKLIEANPGIETLWHLYPHEGTFLYGYAQIGIDHKDFLAFKNQIEKVGTLKIREGLKSWSSRSGIASFRELENNLKDLKCDESEFGYKAFPVALLYER